MDIIKFTYREKIFYLISIYIFVFIRVANPQDSTVTLKEPDLIELIKIDTTFHMDIRYATDKNFTGQAVYTEARAFLQRPAAESLAVVNKELRALGYEIVIFDGYRPWSVTKIFWDITPEDRKEFVADPKNGSRHNRGCSIDVTLFDIAAGCEVKMPSEYDEMSKASYADYSGGTEEERGLRDLLRSKMEKHGFNVLNEEWWHFDFKDWRSYPILNIPFEDIK